MDCKEIGLSMRNWTETTQGSDYWWTHVINLFTAVLKIFWASHLFCYICLFWSAKISKSVHLILSQCVCDFFFYRKWRDLWRKGRHKTHGNLFEIFWRSQMSFSIRREKDVCDRRNISNKFPFVCVCFSSRDIFIFGKSFPFLFCFFHFLCYPYFGTFLSTWFLLLIDKGLCGVKMSPISCAEF